MKFNRTSKPTQTTPTRRAVIIAAVLTLLATIACAMGAAPTDEPTITLPPETAPVNVPGVDTAVGTDPCAIFPEFSMSQTSSPEVVIDTGKHYRAFIVTNRGTIVLDLFADKAPETVNNFMFLSCNNFYDGLTFHRVLPGFMMQGGDPSGNGTGGPSYTIRDEYAQSDLSFNKPGLISMAHTSAPDSAGSQFFITYSVEQTRHLSGSFTIFGELADDASMEVALSITPRDPDDPSSLSITPDKMDTIIIRQLD